MTVNLLKNNVKEPLVFLGGFVYISREHDYE